METTFEFSHAIDIVNKRSLFFANEKDQEDYSFLQELVANAISEKSEIRSADLDRVGTSSVFLYLQKTHAFYTDKLFPEIDALLIQMKRVYQDKSNTVLVLTSLINAFQQDLKAHIFLENHHFFPVVESWLTSKSIVFCDWIAIQDFMKQHDDSSQKLTPLIAYIQSHFNDQLVGRMLTQKLQVLHVDLKIHHQLEEKVLVPRLHKMDY